MSEEKLVAIREFARQKKVSESTMRKHIDMGRIPVVKTPKGNKIKLPDAEIAWSGLHRSNSHTGTFGKLEDDKDQGTDSIDMSQRLSKAKTVKEEYNAKLAQVKFEEQKGILIKRELVEFALFELARGVRDELLAVPSKVSPQAVSMTEIQEIDNLVTEAIHEALLRITEKGVDGFLKDKLKIEAEDADKSD